MTETDLESANTFRSAGLHILRRVLPLETLALVSEYCRLKRGAIKPLYPDNLCPSAYNVYADLVAESLMVTLQPRFEDVCCEKLIPTFSYLRIYGRGCGFEPHFDRPACEISGSLTVESTSREGWALYFDFQGEALPILLAAGDLVVYRGSAIRHWREAFGGDYHAQIIVNYVAAKGALAEWGLDKRERLGQPISPATMSERKRPENTKA